MRLDSLESWLQALGISSESAISPQRREQIRAMNRLHSPPSLSAADFDDTSMFSGRHALGDGQYGVPRGDDALASSSRSRP